MKQIKSKVHKGTIASKTIVHGTLVLFWKLRKWREEGGSVFSQISL